MSPRKLYAPHLNKVKVSLDQGMDQIDWTCQEWQEFTDSCLAEVNIWTLDILNNLSNLQVDIYKDLINRANDIYYSRVEKLLDSIANVEVGTIVKVLADHVFPSYLSCQPRSPGLWNGIAQVILHFCCDLFASE